MIYSRKLLESSIELVLKNYKSFGIAIPELVKMAALEYFIREKECVNHYGMATCKKIIKIALQELQETGQLEFGDEENIEKIQIQLQIKPRKKSDNESFSWNETIQKMYEDKK
jgi:hypothetical protein